MGRTAYLVILKGEKILVYNKSEERYLKVDINNGEDPEEFLSKWTEKNLTGYSKEFLKFSKDISVKGSLYRVFFIDATNSDLSIKIECSNYLQFRNIYFGESINYNEKIILNSIFLDCNDRNYNSFAVESIKNIVYEKKILKSTNNNGIDESVDKSKIKLLAVLTLIIGFLTYKFFFRYLGISVGIFISYLILVFFIINGVKNKNIMGGFLVGISLILSFSYGIFTNDIFRIFNTLLIPISLFSGFLLLNYSDIPLELKRFINIFLERVLDLPAVNSLNIVKILKSVAKEDKVEKQSNIKSITLGLFISVPILIILSIILAGADNMFNYYIANMVNYINIDNIVTVVFKLLVSLVVMAFLFGLYYSFECKNKNVKEIKFKNVKYFNELTVVTMLIAIGVLYIVFTKIQVSYLYLNSVLPQEFDFSSYAREGFFQLVFIVIINLLLITFLKSETNVTSNKVGQILKGLYTLITLLSINMAISAIYKMSLYISAFGYTRLRILVQVFTVFLCLILVFLIFNIWKNKNLLKPVIIVGAIIYVGLNYFNLDNYIVKKNIDNKNLESRIDNQYLITLSLDAYESMLEAKNKGLISDDEYIGWKYKGMDKHLHWYEYNYFYNKQR
ncbi:DUF4153 domain-containing protein [Clostridium septicum]|uniref:DUF4173 domain-containing protein n=1 Tax=Clostridium septicum TaxID=1504 RepID=A0A9N7JN63_CLOSE|nr:DUF4173 domain-containing protein [Clostridium septicum]AYE35224.1 DUF4173 domain-containing protein [Clostridium septicum]MDU1313643.1 DUF4173 domain-containing protein [Clostridium septicum]QAS60619.1 DUF4173 domain-containing protein [Clostridium septicum]UEC20125.1 DUF4173 domain-containing protein [Clostridium septicum]USS01818.1 DUF4173 domain-containing protein [Clostridium septicum]